ncbi:hypothetical protein [Bacillus subtilis]|uniref:hypothetical protein n=1 Tax=Bacillus subtilis TaxID=1423 RepID=UPI0021DA7D3C|nr:hypothetical protein [Bacillus subtilis]
MLHMIDAAHRHKPKKEEEIPLEYRKVIRQKLEDHGFKVAEIDEFQINGEGFIVVKCSGIRRVFIRSRPCHLTIEFCGSPDDYEVTLSK